jgi:hypothetical protein
MSRKKFQKQHKKCVLNIDSKFNVKKSNQLKATRLRNNFFSFFGPILMAPWSPCQVLYISSAYSIKN